MIALVQALQVLSGVLWLLPAGYLLPAVPAMWRGSQQAALATPILAFSWLMVGFSVRWMIWPAALLVMETEELLFWAGLYTLSSICALGVIYGAWLTRRER